MNTYMAYSILIRNNYRFKIQIFLLIINLNLLPMKTKINDYFLKVGFTGRFLSSLMDKKRLL